MSHKVEILADSVAEHGGRLTTYRLYYPMIIHWDLMTHRALSRNSESARVISTIRRIQMCLDDTFIPNPWRSDETKMRPGEPLPDTVQDHCDIIYLALFAKTCAAARSLADLGAHREQINSLFIPFGHIAVVASGTQDAWANFFSLRAVGNPRQELKALAREMHFQYFDSKPKQLEFGQWHTPYTSEEEFPNLADRIAASVARCGRTSYFGFDGKKKPIIDEYERTYQYEKDMHVSPFEHVATPDSDPDFRSGNFRGWIQYRQNLKKSVFSEFPTLD